MSRPTAASASAPSVGTRFPAYATSLGKVLLAFQDDAAIDAYLEPPQLAPLTEHTITSKEELRSALVRGARQGYDSAQDELDYGIVSVAVPVFDVDRRIAAAINCSTSTTRDLARGAGARPACLCCATRRGEIEDALRRWPFLSHSLCGQLNRAFPGAGFSAGVNGRVTPFSECELDFDIRNPLTSETKAASGVPIAKRLSARDSDPQEGRERRDSGMQERRAHFFPHRRIAARQRGCMRSDGSGHAAEPPAATSARIPSSADPAQARAGQQQGDDRRHRAPPLRKSAGRAGGDHCLHRRTRSRRRASSGRSISSASPRT